MRLIGIFVLSVLLNTPAQSQVEVKFPDNNWKLKRTRTFDGGSLYGYINGGAVLYQEYGFKTLQVWDLEYQLEEYSLQIYSMTDDTAAFGIWSVNHSDCDTSGIWLQHDCVNPYQYQAVKGNYYLSIQNSTGKKSSFEKCLQLGANVLPQLSGRVFEIPESFVYLTGEKSSIPYLCFRGEIALQNSYADWAPAFENKRKFTGYLFHNSNEGWTLSLITGIPDSELNKILASLSNINKGGYIKGWFLNASHSLILTGKDTPSCQSAENRILQLLKER